MLISTPALVLAGLILLFWAHWLQAGRHWVSPPPPPPPKKKDFSGRMTSSYILIVCCLLWFKFVFGLNHFTFVSDYSNESKTNENKTNLKIFKPKRNLNHNIQCIRLVVWSHIISMTYFLYRIPGRLNDRRTPLGELNWIFTAVTDTIAWNTLPRGTCTLQIQWLLH